MICSDEVYPSSWCSTPQEARSSSLGILSAKPFDRARPSDLQAWCPLPCCDAQAGLHYESSQWTVWSRLSLLSLSYYGWCRSLFLTAMTWSCCYQGAGSHDSSIYLSCGWDSCFHRLQNWLPRESQFSCLCQHLVSLDFVDLFQYVFSFRKDREASIELRTRSI